LHDEFRKGVKMSNDMTHRLTPIGGANKGTDQAMNLQRMYSTGDMAGIQRYIEQHKKLGIQQMRVIEKGHDLGKNMTMLRVTMAGTGKQVDTYTMSLNRATGALHQVGNA